MNRESPLPSSPSGPRSGPVRGLAPRPAPRWLPCLASLGCLGLALCASLTAGCGGKPDPQVLARFPIDDLEGLVDRSSFVFDAALSSDGRGSARLDTKGPATVRLFETGDLDIENATLILEAKLRTEAFEGRVFVEMLCSFTGKGEFFSRAANAALSGTTDWATQRAPFLLRSGENPDNIRINLIAEGRGTVWIDQVRLTRGPAE